LRPIGTLWRPTTSPCLFLFRLASGLEGWKLRWQFWEKETGKLQHLLFSSERWKSPFSFQLAHSGSTLSPLEFASDIDGDGSDEVIGYDGRWRRCRLYRAEVTKAGELRWRDVLLGREEPKAFAMLVDGERRGLVVALGRWQVRVADDGKQKVANGE
jgi:hypothetical protein